MRSPLTSMATSRRRIMKRPMVPRRIGTVCSICAPIVLRSTISMGFAANVAERGSTAVNRSAARSSSTFMGELAWSLPFFDVRCEPVAYDLGDRSGPEFPPRDRNQDVIACGDDHLGHLAAADDEVEVNRALADFAEECLDDQQLIELDGMK